MAGIPTEGTDEDGNVILPSVTITGTGTAADKVTGSDSTYTSTAGDWGALGAQVSNYSNLTEGYVRNILNSNMAQSDAWMNAWNGLCELIRQFPFMAGLMDMVDDAQSGIHALLGGAQKFIEDLLNAVTCGVFSAVNPTDILNAIGNTLNSLREFLGVNIGWTLQQIVDWLGGILNCIGGLIGGAAHSAGQTLQSVLTLLNDIVTAVFGLFGINGDTIPHLIAEVMNWLNCIGGAIGATVDNGIHTVSAIFSALGGLLSNLLSPFANGTVLSDVVNFATSLIGLLGATLGNGISQLIQWFEDSINWIWNAFSFFTGGPTNQSGKTIMDIITLFTTWIWNMSGGFIAGAGTFLQQVVSSITGVAVELLTDPLGTITQFFSGLGDGVNTLAQNVLEAFAGAIGQTAATLGAWANGLINAFNLPGILQGLWGWLTSIIPIGNISNPVEKVNLLTLGTFETVATLESAAGWSWDSSNDRTGVVGGAAKLDCSVSTGVRALFSNQNVKVAPGDVVSASAYIKTGVDRNNVGYSGSSSSIYLAVVPFIKTQPQTPIPIATRGPSSQWVEFNGDSTPWTVPETNNPNTQVTSIQMMLAVAASGTSGSVYWDDVKLYKNGLLGQHLVSSLPDAFTSLFDGLQGYTPGTTTPTAATPSAAAAAASSARGLANTANTAAGLAQGDVQKTVNGIATTVGGQTSGYNYSANYIGSNFSSFFNKLYGSGQTQPQDTISENAISSVSTTKLSGTIGTGQITDGAVSNTKLAGDGLDAGKFTTGSLPTAQLPDQIKYGVGSGAIVKKTTSGTLSLDAGKRKLGGIGVWDYRDPNTADIRVRPPADGSYFNFAQVVNEGWYQIEVNYGLNSWLNTDSSGNPVRWSYSWNIAPTVWAGQWSTGMSEIAVGPDAMNVTWADGSTTFGTPFGYSNFSCHGSFIVYLYDGWYVAPGYDLRLPGGRTSATNILRSDGTGTDFYFSIALLNRSLA